MENTFFNQFDSKISTELIELGKRLSKTKADVYMLMARKAACLIDCLQYFGLVTLDGYVTSERILDMDSEWLAGKSVIIIDDTIISGTTLFNTIQRLNLARVKNISVHVLSVHKDHYVPELLEDENGQSYLMKPYLILDSTECIKSCSDIVNALSIEARPYDIDFPFLKNIKISENDLDDLLQLSNWYLDDVTSFLQEANDVKSLTFRPNENIKVQFNEKVGCNISDFAMLKIRTYYKLKRKNKNTYHLNILPIVVFKPLDHATINLLFERVIDTVPPDLAELRTQFVSPTSKLRLLQYAFAAKFAELWIECCLWKIKTSVTSVHHSFTTKLLFNPSVIPLVDNIILSRNTLFQFNSVKLKPLDENISISDYEPKSKIDDTSLEALNVLLTEPFLRLYYEKEKIAWEKVKQYKRNVFNHPDYKSLMDRLKIGYPITFLKALVSEYHFYDIDKVISSFLDKAIDSGIVVPITVATETHIYRAYRHGEDVPFGEREEKLCAIVLNAFSKELGRKELQHIWVEKLAVLFIKIGIQNKFLNPIISNTPSLDNTFSYNEKIEKIASIKMYLFGPVVVLADSSQNDSKPYLESGENSSWLVQVLLHKEILIEDPETGLYVFNDFPEVNLDRSLEGKVENIGSLFGKLLRDKTIETDDLTLLTACISPQDTAQALAAEINIFVKRWEPFSKYLLRKLKNTSNYLELSEKIRSGMFFTAINSGLQKFFWFFNKDAKNKIDDVSTQFTDTVYKNIWNEFWSPNLDWEEQSIDKELYKSVINQGLWILSMNTYVRMLEHYFRSQSSAEKDNDKILDKIISDLKLYREKFNLFRANPKTRLIVPFIDTFLDSIGNGGKLPDVMTYFDKIRLLLYSSKSLLDDAELLVNKFGKIETIKRYPNLLYIDISEEQYYQKKRFWLEINDFIHKFKEKLAKSDSNVFLKLLPDNHNILGRGLWIAATGAFRSDTLVNLANGLIMKFSRFVPIRCVLITQLSENYRIKVSGQGSENIKYGYFWNHVDELKDIIRPKEGLFDGSRLTTILEEKDELNTIDELSKLSSTDSRNYGGAKISAITTTELVPVKYVIKEYDFLMENSNARVDVGVITIVTEEMQSMLNILGKDVDDDTMINGRAYYLGYLPAKTKSHSIAVTQQLEPGNLSIILAYNNLIQALNPKLVVLLGIAGSISNTATIGDVVIATKVIYYENRKEIEDKVSRSGQVFKVSANLKGTINKFFNRWGQPGIINSSKNSFKIFEGPIGSGEAVIANSASEIVSWVKEFDRKALAMEMEAGGFLQAFYEGDLYDKQPELGVIVIRGISDHADHKKDDNWRTLASQNAGAVLIEFLKLIPPFIK
ncbi:MAG: hypothetical protein ACO1PI_10225 [Bacteroidota bacterium]